MRILNFDKTNIVRFTIDFWWNTMELINANLDHFLRLNDKVKCDQHVKLWLTTMTQGLEKKLCITTYHQTFHRNCTIIKTKLYVRKCHKKKPLKQYFKSYCPIMCTIWRLAELMTHFIFQRTSILSEFFHSTFKYE